MRSDCLVLLASFLLLTSGCTVAKPPEPPSAFRPVASVSQIMKAVVVPSSDVLFGVAAEAPKDDAGWTAVQNNAVMLMESGNLLMIPGRAKDQEGWLKASQALVEAGMKAFKAAEAKNVDELVMASDLVYNTCEGCHNTYYKDQKGENQ